MPSVIDKIGEIEEAITGSDSIAFDGCHKIYIMKDKTGTQQMQEYEYEHVVPIENVGSAVATVLGWYNDSCGLKFINLVTDAGKENEDYHNVIGQFELDEDEDDEWDDEDDEWDDEEEY